MPQKVSITASTQQTAPGQEGTARASSQFQRRLHCRVDLSANHRLSPVCELTPRRDRGTTESDDVIVVGSGWTSDAKRAAIRFQPKHEPDIQPKSHATTTVVQQPRPGVLSDRHRDVDGRAESTAVVTIAPSNVDQSTVPQTQRQAVTEHLPQNNVAAVKRGRGRPRKYPPKALTVGKQQQTKSTLPQTAAVPQPRDSTNDALRRRLIGDKENVAPRSSGFAVADRDIWTSDFVRDTAKSLRVSGPTANKVAGLHERPKLAELPVNVLLSDDNNNFQKKPTEKMAPSFRLKELDKNKLLSAWNAFKGTLQSDDWSAIGRREQIGDTVKCPAAEPARTASTEVAGDKRPEKIEHRATEQQKKPSEVNQAPVLECGPPSGRDVPCQQTAAKFVHWKHPEIDDKKVSTAEFFDEPLPATSFPFADDFDDNQPLPESLGKPLFTSTPIKLTDVARSAVPGSRPRGARVRFRPARAQVGNDEEDEDVGDRVELSKLAALRSGATQISGVRPADIVRAFRTIDNVAAAAAGTSTLPLSSSHGGLQPTTLPLAAVRTSTLPLTWDGLQPTTLPFAAARTSTLPLTSDGVQRTTLPFAAAAKSTLPLTSNGVPPTTLPLAAVPAAVLDLCTVAEQLPVERHELAAQPVVTETTATTSSSEDASPLPPSEIVPGQLLHFYGSRYDGPPYNLSPSTGGFVTKAARKRPIVDDADAGAADRKRFRSDSAGVAAAGDVTAPLSVVRQSITATGLPQPQPPAISRPEAVASHEADRKHSRSDSTDVAAAGNVTTPITVGPLQPPATNRPDIGAQSQPEMTSRGGVRRAANGVPVDELMRLQHQLSTIRDAMTLRRVVQIIGETGRYCVNDVTFDFDLCNLHPATVARLVHCLDAAPAPAPAPAAPSV